MFDTKLIKVNQDFAQEQILPAAEALRAGELVAFPTETVYGLGANALISEAVSNVFAVKGRPQDNPLIIHLSKQEQLSEIAKNIPQIAYKILDVFAPGPLTVILQKTAKVPDVVSSGLDTVAVRFPSNKVAKTLIDLAGVPVVAPSANLSGKPSPTKAWHVYQDLQGKIPFILDGGTCIYGTESTILDLSVERPEILRPGIITAQEIKERTGIEVQEYNPTALDLKHPKAPGQKYRHYSPSAPVFILKEDKSVGQRLKNLNDGILKILQKYQSKQQEIRIGLFLSEYLIKELDQQKLIENLKDSSCYKISFQIKSYNNDEGALNAAHDLYNQFREFDRQKVDLIICSAEPDVGAGIAYMNRLTKAATSDI